jgi:hypothetical protein
MNFLKKIFGQKKSEKVKADKNPDNTRLIYLLNLYSEHKSSENYKQIVLEVLHGNSYLLLPTVNDEKQDSYGWQVAETEKMLKLTSVRDQDGLKVLGAFSDEKSLFNWAKGSIAYTALETSEITALCQQIGAGRIVINAGQKNMVVLERNRENMQEKVVEKDTEIAIGTPSKPLDNRIIGKLVTNFAKVSTIEEAYQYAQVMNNESSIVLGIRMSSDSDNSKAALFNAVNSAFEGETQEIPVDIMILEKPDFIESVRRIKNALFYSK